MTVPANIHSIKKHVNVLNAILFAVIIIIYFQAIAPLAQLKTGLKMPSAQTRPLNPVAKAADIQFPPFADFMVLAEKNLFHPERKMPLEAKSSPAEQRPELLLHGTIVTDNLRIAYIEEKRANKQPAALQNTTGRNKNQRAMKLGDNINGYILKNIEDESVTFVKGDDKIYISLREQKLNRDSSPETGIGSNQMPASTNRFQYPITGGAAPSNRIPSGTPHLELRRPMR